MKDQELDGLFSQLGNNAFPFDESAWTKAEKVIAAHEAGKRRRAIIIWFLSGLMLLSTGVGVYNYLITPQMGDSKSGVQNPSTEIREKASQVPAESKNEMPSDNANESISDADKSTSGPEDSSLNNVVPNESDAFNANSQSPANGYQDSQLVFVNEETEKPETSDLTESGDFTEIVEPFSMSHLALRNASELPQNLESNPYGNESEAGMIGLPYHWNTRLILIAGVMPLEELGNEGNITSNLPKYYGVGLSKIHNYRIEYSGAIIVEELAYQDNTKSLIQNEYSFDIRTREYEIGRKFGRYLTLPISARYRVFGNHFVTGSVQYSRLMQTYSTLSVSEYGADNQVTVISEDQNIDGYQNDLNKNHVSVIIGYDLGISDRLHLQFTGRLGLNSLYESEFLSDGLSDRICLRMGLEYSLWRF